MKLSVGDFWTLPNISETVFKTWINLDLKGQFIDLFHSLTLKNSIETSKHSFHQKNFQKIIYMACHGGGGKKLIFHIFRLKFFFFQFQNFFLGIFVWSVFEIKLYWHLQIVFLVALQKTIWSQRSLISPKNSKIWNLWLSEFQRNNTKILESRWLFKIDGLQLQISSLEWP